MQGHRIVGGPHSCWQAGGTFHEVHFSSAKRPIRKTHIRPSGAAVSSFMQTIVRSLSFDATGRLEVPPDHAVIVTGDVVDQLRDADWDAILDHENVVFAQTSAQQKERLIWHNRRRRHVVVATGPCTPTSSTPGHIFPC